MKKHFYITTTLPYVNADPHIGFAMEIIRADIVARYKMLTGYDVFFNTGTDEHGMKVYTKALEEKKDTQAYVDHYAAHYKDLRGTLGLWEGLNFIRTTDPTHKKAAQEFWKKCLKAGDIYKKNYKIKYCVGCELEKTDSELVDGKCPLHPNLEIQIIEEENYFFKFSTYQKKLLALYEKNPDFVIPSFRFNEIKAFVERGLEDFSISRLASKMPWGVPVPDDSDHVMYVWFDALVNYISAIGWPMDMKKFETWWPVTQYAGKDNIRQQAAMWQAMLMSAGIAPSKQIIINGFVTGAGGVKMSKSLGNTVSPFDVVNEYGTDALRYFVARELSPFEDSEFTSEKFKRAYNDGLANGLGNLVSRVMKMAVDNDVKINKDDFPSFKFTPSSEQFYKEFNIQKEVNLIWQHLTSLDLRIQERKPFKLVKEKPEEGKAEIKELLKLLFLDALQLQPIMPATSEKIIELIKNNKTPEKPLFLRKD